MTKGQIITVHYAMEKTTPGTIRYQEVDSKGNPVKADAAKAPTLYIKKTALGADIPQKLQVQITAQ